MTINEAVNAFKKAYPNENPIKAIDKSDKFILMTDAELEGFYFVDKKTGDAGSFNPTSDLSLLSNPSKIINL